MVIKRGLVIHGFFPVVFVCLCVSCSEKTVGLSDWTDDVLEKKKQKKDAAGQVKVMCSPITFQLFRNGLIIFLDFVCFLFVLVCPCLCFLCSGIPPGRKGSGR